MSADAAGHPDEGTLAAYALGGLGPDETVAHERHLQGCDACRGQLAELGEVRRMLGLVHASLVVEDPALAGDTAGQVPVISGPRAVRRGHFTQRIRRRWLPAVAIAVATAVGAVLVPVLVTRGGVPGDGRPPAAVVMAGFDVNTHVSATMRLRPGPTASTFVLRLTGVPTETTLRVVADLTDGSTVPAGKWPVPPHNASTVFEVSGSVDVKVFDLTGFRVLASDGSLLVDLAMPGTRSG